MLVLLVDGVHRARHGLKAQPTSIILGLLSVDIGLVATLIVLRYIFSIDILPFTILLAFVLSILGFFLWMLITPWEKDVAEWRLYGLTGRFAEYRNRLRCFFVESVFFIGTVCYLAANYVLFHSTHLVW